MPIPDAAPPLLARAEGGPCARILSNGRLTTLLTAAGAGFTNFGWRRVTDWRPDPLGEGGGLFFYLRDEEDGALWSAGLAPVAGEPERYEVSGEPGSLAITRLERGIEAITEVVVVPDGDAELRSLWLCNLGRRPRRLSVTTCAGLVLHHPGAHAGHPAFSKLFVQTRLDPEAGVLLARRRPREPEPEPLHAAHALFGPGEASFETDRARFLGRGRSAARPAALDPGARLSGTLGSVLDPIATVRREFRLAPGEKVAFCSVVACAGSEGDALALARRFGEAGAFEAARDASRDRARQRIADLGLTAGQGAYLEALLARMLHGSPELRAPAEVLRRARGTPEDLWVFGIPPDQPLLAVEEGQRARALLGEAGRAAGYWAALGLPVQVLSLREAAEKSSEPRFLDSARACARLLLRDAWPELPAEARPRIVPPYQPVRPTLSRGSGAEPHLGDEERRRGETERATGSMGPGAEPHLDDEERQQGETERATRSMGPVRSMGLGAEARLGEGEQRRGDMERVDGRREEGEEELLFWNGVGGFAADGRDYVMRLGAPPPQPWVNVMATPSFGTLVSERGAATTWSRNSREHRLTPWANDPVEDPHGEALWIRDEEERAFWSPQPGPTPSGAVCEVRHGFGVSSWRQECRGLAQEVTTLVPPDAPLKLTRIRITNRGEGPRELSVFSYARLVLGVLPEDDARAVVAEIVAGGRLMRARNGLAGPFADGVAFAALTCDGDDAQHACCADRQAFLGPGGAPAAPRALLEDGVLAGANGAPIDACFAQQARFTIPAGASAECIAMLGEARDAAQVDRLAARFGAPGGFDAALAAVRRHWEEILGGVRVKTPSAALDLMVNGWLGYQTLSCRIQGRTAFYQSGGAFGFRDQLQDAAAFATTRPELARQQILLHAAHQFPEGDVLHWWHPPLDRGTRTRFSDDLLWLPYVAAHYVDTTGDRALLDEEVGFVSARSLEAGEDEAYLQTAPAEQRASLYEHCCRAIDRSLAVGAHGLPLMGTGDWNDGMNRVGREGRGESVWMAFFLFDVLRRFEPLCAARGDAQRAGRYATHRAALARAVEASGWDGGWYRRAFFDDGTTLGSAAAEECRIDLLPQAWSVISGAAPREHAEAAMDAVERELLLVDGEEDGLIRLLAPPFDRMAPSPGYIQGYVPGIRENGGQYTHAALWAVRAMAELGRRDRALAWLEMLLPLHHAQTPAGVARYQVEPYAVAADVYAVAPHVGRGGWTWYTGSAGWMLRVALESLLGLRMQEGQLLWLRPCVPDTWPGFEIELRLPGHGTRVAFSVRSPAGCAARVVRVRVDGRETAPVEGSARIEITPDGGRHLVEVELGAA